MQIQKVNVLLHSKPLYETVTFVKFIGFERNLSLIMMMRLWKIQPAHLNIFNYHFFEKKNKKHMNAFYPSASGSYQLGNLFGMIRPMVHICFLPH